MRNKIEELQARQQGGGGGQLQPGELSGATAASIGSLTMPETSYESEDLDKYLPAAAKGGASPITFNAPKSSTPQYYEPPSRAWQCAYKLQNGFMIGASLGGAVGFLYGTWAAIAYKHVLYLPIAVLQSGGFFGLFLACGTVIRCEETGEVRALRHAAAGRCGVDDDDAWARARSIDDFRPRRADVVAAVVPAAPAARRSAITSAIFD